MPQSNPLHPAEQRLALWIAACRQEITVEELYRCLGELRQRYGEAVYVQPARRQRHAA